MKAVTHERIRVLYTIPNFITAGSGGAVVSLASRLDPDQFEPMFAVLKRGGTLESKIKQRGWPLFEFPFCLEAKPRVTLPVRAWRRARALPWPRPHVWHSFHYADDYTEPLVARASGVRAWIYTKKNMNWRGRAWRLRTMLAHRVIAQNVDMMKGFFSHTGKAHLVRRGVDVETFDPDRVSGLGVRARCGIPINKPLIGCVGHVLPVKMHSVAIRALALTSGAHLVIAGSDTSAPLVDKLRALAVELGVSTRVHFLGNVSEVAGFLADVDVFLHPSQQEGSPVALLEAMSMARAVVVSDVPGSRDLVEDGESGRVVPVGDALATADAIHGLLRAPDLRMRMGRAARERVLAHFTIRHEARSHEAVYEDIATSLGLAAR